MNEKKQNEKVCLLNCSFIYMIVNWISHNIVSCNPTQMWFGCYPRRLHYKMYIWSAEMNQCQTVETNKVTLLQNNNLFVKAEITCVINDWIIHYLGIFCSPITRRSASRLGQHQWPSELQIDEVWGRSSSCPEDPQDWKTGPYAHQHHDCSCTAPTHWGRASQDGWVEQWGTHSYSYSFLSFSFFLFKQLQNSLQISKTAFWEHLTF